VLLSIWLPYGPPLAPVSGDIQKFSTKQEMEHPMTLLFC
jgi:hypothetical protein